MKCAAHLKLYQNQENYLSAVKKYAYNKVQIKEFSEIKFNQPKFDLVVQATMLLLFKNNKRNIFKCRYFSSFLIFDLMSNFIL